MFRFGISPRPLAVYCHLMTSGSIYKGVKFILIFFWFCIILAKGIYMEVLVRFKSDLPLLEHYIYIYIYNADLFHRPPLFQVAVQLVLLLSSRRSIVSNRSQSKARGFTTACSLHVCIIIFFFYFVSLVVVDSTRTPGTMLQVGEIFTSR